MHPHNNKQSHRSTTAAPVFHRSLLALCIMALAAPVVAQTDGSVDEVVVTGVRANLQSAQEIKRNADTVVDSISAEDIGSLPDRSVLEAMQRVPGVSIERFASANDPDHFSTEGSGAVIRGMNATRSEFNGRDSFTANSGRGLSFQDVPPELMGGVDIYKNQTADMIEGGIGGTVSLRTRKPFDSDGRVVAISADYSYGDMAEDWTPTVSALYSDRWDTDAGEFGLLLNVADSSLTGMSNGIQSDAYVKYDASVLAGAERFVGADGKGTVWMPNGSNALMKTDERDRQGFAAALQWKNTDETILGTFQYMRSDAELNWTEYAIKYQGGYYDEGSKTDVRRTRPLEGTEFSFTDEGIFTAGTLTDSDGWRSADGNTNRIPRAWGDDPVNIPQWGHIFSTDTRYKSTRTLVDDYSFNLKFTPNDNWEYSLDLQYIDASTDDDDVTVMLATHAMQDYDTRGSTPSLTLIEPWNGFRTKNPDIYATGFPGFSGDPAGDSNYFQDPTSYFWQAAMDHYERSEGDSLASRIDIKHTLDDNFITSISGGLRLAEREQTVRSSIYNWGALGPRWQQDIYWADLEKVSGQEYTQVDWSDFHRGGVLTIPGDGMLHASPSLVKDVINGRELLAAAGSFIPANKRAGTTDFFTPSEVYVTKETNEAAYVKVDFGSDDYALRFSGNLGLRYVRLERDALGSVQYPDLVPDSAAPAGISLPLTSAAVEAWTVQASQALYEQGGYADLAAARTALLAMPSSKWTSDPNNFLSNDERGFGNNAFTVQNANSTYSATLPSLNLKVELSDDLISRFAVAKAIALPDMEAVKNQANLSSLALNIEQPERDPLNPSAGGGILGAEVAGWRGSSGNPGLKPMESTQFDASLEWYFASVGSLTTTVFYKDLSNFFVYGTFARNFTNPVSGVTQTVEVEGTRNGGDGTMQGFEVAYQQFYDMLPAPWDGLGLQVNYTYIDANGVPNGGDESADGFAGTATDTGARVDLANVPLQGQSKDTFNVVAMYDKNDWSLRLAYNWRSKYLLTTRDVISKYPLWNDASGFLDGSAFYNINDNVTVGLQLTNIANTQTKTIMILDGEGAEAGRSWFVNDRRAALILKATF
ncbi:MAG: TonB-dependent receptor [Cellvibrio sp.]|uniref:TonB-dependent receptor n=1 Tax=Cellvibrio sp. TaxID=1965322 RepID=UPI0031A44421